MKVGRFWRLPPIQQLAILGLSRLNLGITEPAGMLPGTEILHRTSACWCGRAIGDYDTRSLSAEPEKNSIRLRRSEIGGLRNRGRQHRLLSVPVRAQATNLIKTDELWRKS